MTCVKRDHSQGAPEYEYYTKNCDDVGRNFENIRRIDFIIKTIRNSKSMRWVLFYTVMPSKSYDEILVLPTTAFYFHFMLPFSRFLNEEVGKHVK